MQSASDSSVLNPLLTTVSGRENPSALFEWMPTEAGAVYRVKVAVSDNGLPPLSETKEFTLVVTAPQFVSANGAAIPASGQFNYHIVEGELLKLAIVAKDSRDLETAMLRYQLEGAPNGAAVNPDVDPSSGEVLPGMARLTWEPLAGQDAGEFTFTLRVFEDWDGDGLFDRGLEASAALRLHVTVDQVSQPPITTAPRLKYVGDKVVQAGSKLSFQVSIEDADTTPVTFRWDTPQFQPPVPGMTLNPATGVVEWTPAHAQAPGKYQVAVLAFGRGGAVASTGPIQITVLDVDRHPVVSGLVFAGEDGKELQELKGTSGAFEADELKVVSATLLASDPEGELLTFVAEDLPAGAVFDSATGVFTWQPSEEQGPGVYAIRLLAQEGSDATKSASFDLELRVKESYQSPMVAAVPKVSVPEFTVVAIPLAATDPNRPVSPLRYELLGYHRDGGKELANDTIFANVDAISGLFTWTPNSTFGGATISPVVRVYADVQRNGKYDSGDPSFDVSFDVGVVKVDRPPVFMPVSSLTAQEHVPVNVTLRAGDPDGRAAIRYELSQRTLAILRGATVNAETGLFSWTPDEESGGRVFSVTVKATEFMGAASGLSTEQQFTVTVAETNTAPEVVSVTDAGLKKVLIVQAGAVYARVVAGQPMTLNIRVLDPDQPVNRLSCALAAGAQDGAAFTGENGLYVLSWTPPANSPPNEKTIAVEVTDNGSPSGKATLKVVVRVMRCAVDKCVANGDADGDGVTNEKDLYRVWQVSRQPSATQNLNDDLTGDGMVDGEDLGIVRRNLGSRAVAVLGAEDQTQSNTAQANLPTSLAEPAVVVAAGPTVGATRSTVPALLYAGQTAARPGILRPVETSLAGLSVTRAATRPARSLANLGASYCSQTNCLLGMPGRVEPAAVALSVLAPMSARIGHADGSFERMPRELDLIAENTILPWLSEVIPAEPQ